MPLTNPHNFQNSSKWTHINKYSQFVTNTLKPYINIQTTPPYYQGSYSIFSTTQQNKADSFNLRNGIGGGPSISSTANVNLAAPLPKPGPPDKKLSELTQEEYREATVRKPVNFGRETLFANVGSREKMTKSLNSDVISPLDRIISNHTNQTDGNALKSLGASLALGGTQNLGVPLLGQAGTSFAGAKTEPSYTTVPFLSLKRGGIEGIPFPYQDFRSYKSDALPSSAADVLGKRIDGTAAVARKKSGKARAAAYLAASITPGGSYKVFNKESLYGEGDAGNSFALRNDFTAKTVASTQWDTTTEKWIKTKEALALVNAFRGDKVNVIDFKKSTYGDAYRWLGKLESDQGDFRKKIGKVLGSVLNDPGVTQDYIKFFFTGPNIGFGDTDSIDDIITFRAVITNLFDSYNPGYTPVQMIGRADPNYHYTQFSRDMNLDFDIHANDRDELKPIWRKLNALAGYTAPTYDKETIALIAPYMRITIGDILVQQPILIQSLTLTLADSDTTWDINIEGDNTRMQVSNKISVSMGFTIITDYLPEKGGRFYTLAKEADDSPRYHKPGETNWLSDFDVDIKKRITPATAEEETPVKPSIDDLIGPGGVGGENFK
mgnify:CR=1 FL=1|tara:strand:+ start:329 stop:2149 length:1821 start_codon:yes stop_codon:yes gene_type:complete